MRAGRSTRVMPASKQPTGSFRPAHPQCRDGGAGVLVLVPSVKLRRRQIERPIIVLIDEPAAFLGRGPVLARNRQSGACMRAACRSMTASASRIWFTVTAGTSSSRMPAFSAAMSSERVAEKVAVVERQFGDDACDPDARRRWSRRPAAEPDFEQEHVGRMARERRKPAAVAISNTVIGALPFSASHSASASESSSSSTSLPPPSRPIRKLSLMRTRLGEV